ncbi:MAG: hypothetical protein U9P73_07770 [Candidatus Cloacimonadota bacterium]|nr:hypothetical protein [Candidatus Cloacimonadota bacterium]
MKNMLIFCLILLSMSANTFANTNHENQNFSVYIDYERGDMNYIKEKITNVNYVRYKNEADIYILFTKQSTGSNGKKFTVDFTGENIFSGIDESLSFILENGDTDEVERLKSVQILKLGLIRYFSRTDMADKLTITFPTETIEKVLEDRWNNWVFSMSLSGYFNGEESSNSLNTWGSLSASKVTEEMKVQFRFNGSMNKSRFEWGDDVYESSSNSKSINAHLVTTCTDHFSFGFWTYIYSSSYSNIDVKFGLNPGIEYNIFPYSESNRKQLRFQYYLNPSYVYYTEKTIYEKFSEELLKHSFTTELEFIQAWGSVEISLTASQYLMIDNKILENLEKNKLTVRGNVSWRIYKGLSLNLWGNTSRVHDQLSLAAGDVSTEELLLKQKELQTQYTYFLSIGLSYSFGSIYNNIVNPRFGD